MATIERKPSEMNAARQSNGLGPGLLTATVTEAARVDSLKKLFADMNLPPTDLYQLAVKFFKEKEGSKALLISYKDRMRMLALMNHVRFGKFRPDKVGDLGFLNITGNDRKRMWESLGEMAPEQAMNDFLTSLVTFCPLFQPYAKAHIELKRKDLEEELKSVQAYEKNKEAQESLIRAALNRQTQAQFKQYARVLFPKNLTEQQRVIQQLEEQHFAQYMEQVYHAHQQLDGAQPSQQLAGSAFLFPTHPGYVPQLAVPASRGGIAPPEIPSTTPRGANGRQRSSTESKIATVANVDNGIGMKYEKNLSERFRSVAQPMNEQLVGASSIAEQQSGTQPIKTPINTPRNTPVKPASDTKGEPASVWTRLDRTQFIESVRQDPESIISIASGESVTVRVPTQAGGTCLFWEFATDARDIGFGLYYEQFLPDSAEALSLAAAQLSISSDAAAQQVNNGSSSAGVAAQHVTVSKTNDLSDGEEEDIATFASLTTRGEVSPRHVTEIVPVGRHNAHVGVICGSHAYPPTPGIYHMKFDNSYSLWNAKTVFYRVYYTK